MRISEVARVVEVSPSSIRHYEGNGLLPPACRDALGYRTYSQADLERIKLVTGARQLGISFADIKEILAIRDEHQSPSARILDLLREKASEVEQRNLLLASVRLELCRLRGAALERSPLDSARSGSGNHKVLE